MKYSYDKKILKDLSVKPFFEAVEKRNEKIYQSSDTIFNEDYNVNRLAGKLHPVIQYAVISQVIDRGIAKSFILVPDKKRGTDSLAYFRAGQYVSIRIYLGGAILTRPYTICSSPKAAIGTDNTSYMFTIKKKQRGYVSDFIINNWKVGSHITMTGPLGLFCYERLRDAKDIIGIAGGSGITPFYSLAQAIADGTEDCSLTILYGNRTKDSIMLKDELEETAEISNNRVKIINVLSDEKAEGFETGYITADIIKKYAPKGDYSVFMSGPSAMYDFVYKELKKLNIKRRHIRKEFYGGYNKPQYNTGKFSMEYGITVFIRDKKYLVYCRSDQTLLTAIEQAGICIASNCRNGECGWCNSRLISGEIYIPDGMDMRCMADKKYGWIHPCTSYPLSDIEIEVPMGR